MHEWWAILSESEQVLLIIAGLSLLGLLFFYLFFFLRIAFHKNPEPNPDQLPPLSVIICARNEAENIIDYLPKILSQNYPEFEVIVVDDASWDGTGDELAELDKTNDHLHVVTIAEHIKHRPGKKFPLTLGIKKAKNEHLVLTDADCFPASENWLQHMASAFGEGREIVIAPGPYAPAKGLLNALVRFEGLQTGALFLSFAMAGIPYMGVGRNLAYRKSTYNRVGGFKKHYHIMSGDDDLFVQEAASSKNTAVCTHSDALVFTPSADSWKSWWNQKMRHYSTSSHYKWGFKILLGLYPLFILSFFVAAISLLVYEKTQHIALAGIGVKLIAQLAIFRLVFSAQKDRWIWLFSPLLELILLINQIVVALVGMVSKQSRWK